MTAGIPILVAILLQLGLAAVVFQSNPKRKSNQAFLVLATATVLWLSALYYASTATTTRAAVLGIREASAAAALVLCSFNLLRLSIRGEQKEWSAVLRRSRAWFLGTAGVIIFCQTDWFLVGARLGDPIYEDAAPTPIYGHPGIYLYLGCFVVALLLLAIGAIRDLKQTRAGERAELAFVLIGGLFTLILTSLGPAILGRFIDPVRLLWFAPFRVVCFCLVVAYGIATRRIMEVGLLLRRFISYTLLTGYLLGVYAVIWWLVAHVVHGTSAEHAREIAHVVAAIGIAFAMAPARGISQRLAERLFISTQRVDFRETMNKAASILGSVTTLDDLLKRFATTIADAVKAERVAILLHARDRFE
jgi:hypothetical protein